ncbi:UPF0175 family protein [Synechococcus sp. C9]|jgi:predicted HTH domain antitoxin|uniref:UPF0175 family protein n=1 Tax=Synechococcus sp. C9 TaxID=102119 RepID=UPI001FF468F6|nr:UPF0175 family protein [Synechococcus sp. C9]
MSLVIPDDFLETAHISEAELKLEIAVLLFQQDKINLGIASQFAGMNQQEFLHILRSRKLPIDDGVADLGKDLTDLEANGVHQAEVQPSQAEILQRIEQRRTFCPAQYHLPDTLTFLQQDRNR